MNKKDQMIFSQRLSILISSGISLGEALRIITKMEKSPKKVKIQNHILESVEKGYSLSKSILSSKIKFDSTLLMMIKNGESSGTLSLSLKQAASTLERGIELKKKIISTLIYPMFIALATAGMALFLVLFIFPKIIPLLTSMNVSLPFLTKLVQKGYRFLIEYGIVTCVITFILIFCLFILYKKVLRVRKLFQFVIFKIPLIGITLKKIVISIYFRSAGMLLSHGQSLVSILDEAGKSKAYEVYKMFWEEGSREVSRGVSLSEYIKKYPHLFPSLVPDMISIGERTGKTNDMFIQISKIYEEEIDHSIKQFSTFIEPVLMILMGILVGSIALSIILPIYEITNHLSPK